MSVQIDFGLANVAGSPDEYDQPVSSLQTRFLGTSVCESDHISFDKRWKGTYRHDCRRIQRPNTAWKSGRQVIELPVDEIEERVPQKTSMMSNNLADQLTVEEFRDLLAYLEQLWN